ncbi:hypothetical protein COO20_10475 [Thalassospira marina]|uniref:Uncharacterized protein n=1 Tax=Thalassospira marina TaxID=2048283 RepID=A0A2N3KTV8_9PROT|nr:hypothetical protein COO20_10475 [Thalassospira marina]
MTGAGGKRQLGDGHAMKADDIEKTRQVCPGLFYWSVRSQIQSAMVRIPSTRAGGNPCYFSGM